MIRINLLKPLQLQSAPLIFDEPRTKGKKLFFIVGGLVIVALGAVAVLQYPSLLGGLLAKKEPVVVEEVSPQPKSASLDTMQPKTVTANAVEETVRDVGDQTERQAPPPTYAELVPSEKIEFQYYACSRILKDIKSVTPPEVGFANFIFTLPGEFYVHGLANDQENFQRFKQSLSALENATIRPGLDVPAGVHGSGKEFSFYGTIKYPLNAIPVPGDHTVSKAKLQEELAQLKSVAAGLGIKLKEPKLLSTVAVGQGKRMIYQTAADCSFQQMQDLLAELHQAKSNLGFLKFALHARSDEKVVADMDILAYVN